MNGTFALSISAPPATAVGSATSAADGSPVQRFIKSVIPVGHFVKRDSITKKVLWELDVTPERQQTWCDAFRAMRTGGVSVRLMDESGNFTIDAPKTPLTKNHAGAFDLPSKRLKNLAENVVGETVDMFIGDDGWLKTVHDVSGKEAIDLITRAKFTSPEIDPCYIDGTDKKHGEAITAISIVAKPLIPGQSEFMPIAASADEPMRHVLTLESSEEPSMTKASLASLALIAAAAGVTGPITEANAEATLAGLQGRLTKALAAEEPATQAIKCKLCGKESDAIPLCSGCSMKTRMMSADGPEATGLGLSARLMEKAVEDAFRPIVSDAGLVAVKAALIGDRTKKQYSTFVLSHENPEAALNSIEALCEVIRKNPALRKGPQTQLQGTVALSDEHAGEANKPPTPEQLAKMLSYSETGRAILESSRK